MFLDSAFIWVRNEFPKLNGKNSTITKSTSGPKTFVASHAYGFFLQKLNSVDGLSIWLCMQKIWIFEEIQNENSKRKWKWIKNQFFV